jgi:hypothetical protein
MEIDALQPQRQGKPPRSASVPQTLFSPKRNYDREGQWAKEE